MSTARHPTTRPDAARTDTSPPDAAAAEDAARTRRRRRRALHPHGGRRLLAPFAGLAATAALLAGCGGTEAPAEDTASATSEESSAESTDEGGDGSATAEQTSDGGDDADDTAGADDDGTDDDTTDGDGADDSTDDLDDASGGGEVNLFEGTWGIGHDEKALDAEQLAALLEEQAEALGPPEMSLDVECEDGVDTAVQDYEAACIAYADEGVEHPWSITAGPADGGLEIEVANEG